MDKQNKKVYFISDVSKLLGVESHVLRYWEEELDLRIKRNDMGHRCYEEKDVEQFLRVMELKKKGLQLRAIRKMVNPEQSSNLAALTASSVIKSADKPELQKAEATPETGDKLKRLQYLLASMISDAVKTAFSDNNVALTEQLKSSVVKEMDYQFRIREERDEENRKKEFIQHQEMLNEHFKKVDDALFLKRSKLKPKRTLFGRCDKNPGQAAVVAMKNALGD